MTADCCDFAIRRMAEDGESAVALADQGRTTDATVATNLLGFSSVFKSPLRNNANAARRQSSNQRSKILFYRLNRSDRTSEHEKLKYNSSAQSRRASKS